MAKQGTRTPGSGGFTGPGGKLPNMDKRTIIETGCKNSRDLAAAVKGQFKGVESSAMGSIVKVSCSSTHYDAIKAYLKSNKEV